MTESIRKIYLASSRGFCAGVIRAVKLVENTLAEYGPPVFVHHDIVHNEYVVNGFREKGVIFVESLTEISKGRPVIFSAHGVSPEVEKKAETLGLYSIDATCPLVKKIHKKAVSLRKEGYTVILIGHKKHPEIIGTLGHLGGEGIVVESIMDVDKLNISKDIKKITYLTQTTLSPADVEDIITKLQERFHSLTHPVSTNICYATLDRQDAVRALTEKCSTIFVIGSSASSNSRRLKEVAERIGARTFLINTWSDITEDMLGTTGNIGITAGASAPETLVSELILFLTDKGFKIAD